jgi:hypothetical protein
MPSADACLAASANDHQPTAADADGFHAANRKFKGMPNSPGITNRTVVDAYLGMYKTVIRLDERELRTLAGKLVGTVGVEHTVDFFLGYVNFKAAAGSQVLDSLAAQTNLHVEKTNFFTVSTHGTNEYTFLEYVNMRLVTVYKQDIDFSDDGDGLNNRTLQTDESNAADYVQVTFTMGPQYNADQSGTIPQLIPTDGVRAGRGMFYESTTMEHKCMQYNGASGYDVFDGVEQINGASRKDTFVARMGQASCAPAATMCKSPESVPDQFVVYNIPLGIDYFGEPKSDLSNNVFVDMVISAIDKDKVGENGAYDEADQVKTTLTASIPVVAGGLNIFCDGVLAKTTLRDVADADIVVGTASDMSELSRLTIKEDISNDSDAIDDDGVINPTRIDTASIESGFLTLVLKGNSSYFNDNAGVQTRGVSLELEDLITIHLMSSSGDGESNPDDDAVLDLIKDVSGVDNTDTNGIITEGYKLNEAFEFVMDRSAQRAYLSPTSALLEICPYNAPRPAASAEVNTCITRRDVQYRQYPFRVGGTSTAMEICANVEELDTATSKFQGTECEDCCGTLTADACEANFQDAYKSDEAIFMTQVLGDSCFSRELAHNFARTIDEKYGLNGRYRRAFWINPGYEWLPTQTGGKSLFTISQKVYLFALITMDEGISQNAGAPYDSNEASLSLIDDAEAADSRPGPLVGNPNGLYPEARQGRQDPLRRRRMLLQTATDTTPRSGTTGATGQSFEYEVTSKSLFAAAYDVPAARVATWTVEMKLTQQQACMDKNVLADSLREQLEDYLTDQTTQYHTLQITTMKLSGVDGVACRRRSIRSLLALTGATAEVTMMIVFKEGSKSLFKADKLRSNEAISSVEALDISNDVDGEFPAAQDFPDPKNVNTNNDEKDGGGSGSNVALIAGICGGVGAVAVLAAGLVMYMRTKSTAEPVTAVQTINVEDLKSQLSEEV